MMTERMIELMRDNLQLNLLIARIQINLEEATHPMGDEPLRLIQRCLRDITNTLEKEKK